MSTDIKTLISHLNRTCRRSLETAAELCVSQTHYNVEVEHLLLKLLDQSQTDLHAILAAFSIDGSRLRGQLQDSIATFKRGNTRTPAFSPHLPTLLEEAWVRSSLQLNEPKVRSGAIVLALLENDALRGMLLSTAPILLNANAARLRSEFPGITAASAEGPGGPAAVMGAGGESARVGESLATYTVDLTAEARAGRIDPVFGRDGEIRQVIDILLRRRQNNPILTGEAGVGKTAVVEGFANRVVAGDVPPALRNVSVRTLDMGLLQAGAGVRGEFENRLNGVISEVKASPTPVILFIDEAHTIIGAGNSAGQGDAANLLKPALARGELRTIAATTWSEYKKYFEKDPALTRRFQVVKVDEPDETTAIGMVRGLVPRLEKHHKVRMRDAAVVDAVRLSARYISGRQLPDKAISVLDTACARIALAQSSPPPELEQVARQVKALEDEKALLERENAPSNDHTGRLDELADELARLEDKRMSLDQRWQQQLETVRKIIALEARRDAAEGSEREYLSKELDTLALELEVQQGDMPMVSPYVDHNVVASVISAWTGIPVGKMVSDEIKAVLGLRDRMSQRIIGQRHAIDLIAKRIQVSRAGLAEPGKPTAVFLLVGPSGVGKTETALTVADLLYGGARTMVTINMSEYQEAHSVSNLKGAPPGYVGYGTGGILTEAVRRNPYSVVLLDEVEKAHPDVIELFYQVFDKGMLEDSEGVVVDFKNTIIMLTSNLGTDTIARACRPGHPAPEAETLLDLVRPELTGHFKPALMGRLTVVPYYPLNDEQIREIVKLKLAKVQARFEENHHATFSYDQLLVRTIADRCTETDTGARTIDHILENSLLPILSEQVLDLMSREETFGEVHASVDGSGGFAFQFHAPGG